MDKPVTSPITINNYDDLLREKARLKELLKIHRANIQRNMDAIREEVNPLMKASSMLSKLFIRENGKDPVLQVGTNMTIDILAARFFSKSNFFLRLVVPVLLKNFTSHFLPRMLLLTKKHDDTDHKSKRIEAGREAQPV